jgi:phosphoglycolate phosphatase-like HAD superfamily hydrolase
MPAAAPIIAIDGDGVLLNYNQAFGAVWNRQFNTVLTPHEPRAYHAHTFWNVTLPPHPHAFWDRFDAEGWSAMPAMEGAVDACHRLVAAGYQLVCVTSMPAHRAGDRQANLHLHGFPIHRVVATGSALPGTENPKLTALRALAPVWMVDDELRKLQDLDGIQLALIDPGHPDSPNGDRPRDHLAMVVPHLAAFADRLLARPLSL